MTRATCYILLCFACLSCGTENNQGDKLIAPIRIEIPSIERSLSDTGFKLVNGVLTLDNSPYSGIVNDFYPDQKIKTKSKYFQGKRYGYYRGWHNNGNKWFERNYTNGIKTGTHVGWFPSGQQLFYFEFNAHGVYDGAVKEWHSNGELAQHFNFENGKEAGSQKMWGQDGKLRANFFTVNGERHGLIGLKNCASVVANK